MRDRGSCHPSFTVMVEKRGLLLCRRVGQMDEAKASFEKALALTSQEQQRRFLERRLAEIK